VPDTLDLPATCTADPGWRIVAEGFTLAREHEVESLLAISNGYLGVRASLAEGSPLSAPATFLAGVFEAKADSIPGRVMLPEWTRLTFAVDGAPLRLDRGRNLEHRRILDMRQGLLWRTWRHQDAAGRITHLAELRLASLADRQLLVQCVAVTPENYSGTLRLFAPVSGPVTHVSDRGTFVAMDVTGRVADASGNRVDLAAAAVSREGMAVRQGETCRIDRAAAVYTSQDARRPRRAARDHAERAIGDVEGAVGRHRAAWQARWEASDIRIDGDRAAERALRFAAYHLSGAANPEDERISVGARALTGTAYKGHVFWDTDIFMLPFYALTYPEAARALVMYRYHTLSGARAKAAARGYRGALYAWESIDHGEEATPPFTVAPGGEVVRILAGEQEQHISADVAYGVWTYWQATRDQRFLLDAGAEILVETARFWASRVQPGDDGRCHIRGVIGPDEYHDTVDDNAYTNGLAQWNLETAAEAARLIAQTWPDDWRGLTQRLGLDQEEPHRWLAIARNLYTGFDERTGLFEQFRGYFALKDIDLAPYAARTAPLDVLLGAERVKRSKIIKQADVVMLVLLLWDRLPPAVRRANFDYYEPRCGHGSSLSPAIHALVAARLGEAGLAERYFRQAADIDLADNMGNAAGGVHAGALGGLWQAAVLGFAGLRLGGARPGLSPCLPPSWHRLTARFQWRGRRYELAAPGGIREIPHTGSGP
jgi:kojibiose phosphorylase